MIGDVMLKILERKKTLLKRLLKEYDSCISLVYKLDTIIWDKWSFCGSWKWIRICQGSSFVTYFAVNDAQACTPGRSHLMRSLLCTLNRVSDRTSSFDMERLAWRRVTPRSMLHNERNVELEIASAFMLSMLLLRDETISHPWLGARFQSRWRHTLCSSGVSACKNMCIKCKSPSETTRRYLLLHHFTQFFLPSPFHRRPTPLSTSITKEVWCNHDE
jgi:hypothetical protein